MNDNAVKYEVINKETREISPVDMMEFGDGVVTAVVGEARIDFANPNKDGNLTSETHLIREIGTNKAPNGVDIVDIDAILGAAE